MKYEERVRLAALKIRLCARAWHESRVPFRADTIYPISKSGGMIRQLLTFRDKLSRQITGRRYVRIS